MLIFLVHLVKVVGVPSGYQLQVMGGSGLTLTTKKLRITRRDTVKHGSWGAGIWETRHWTTTSYVSYNRTINNFFSPDTWVHITWIRNGNDYSLYKNGALVQRWAVTKSLHVKNYFFIGRVKNYFNGEIDDVQVYSGAILKSQVRVVMRGQVVDQPLAVHITFDGSSFNDAKKDRSKNNRTVSAHGGVNENSLTHAVR